jgi:hypothetical protein
VSVRAPHFCVTCPKMKFTLFYNGPLKTNADAHTKHQLRCCFHPQLKRAIEQSPSLLRGQYMGQFELFSENQSLSVDGKSFLALAAPHKGSPDTSTVLHASVRLDITMLRAGGIGSLVSNGGDIDNRMKTLLDALTIPDQNQAKNVEPTDMPDGAMVCLMSDDKIISDLRIATAQLLDVDDKSRDVVLLIAVTIEGGALN